MANVLIVMLIIFAMMIFCAFVAAVARVNDLPRTLEDRAAKMLSDSEDEQENEGYVELDINFLPGDYLAPTGPMGLLRSPDFRIITKLDTTDRMLVISLSNERAPYGLYAYVLVRGVMGYADASMCKRVFDDSPRQTR